MSESAPTALVVDDDESVRWAYTQILIQRGYTVTEACDGKEALDILSENRRFNLLLTDLNMPRVDGASLIVELVERGYTFDTVILATAAHLEEPIIEHVRAAVSEQFPFFVLSKPISISELYEILASLMRNSKKQC